MNDYMTQMGQLNNNFSLYDKSMMSQQNMPNNNAWSQMENSFGQLQGQNIGQIGNYPGQLQSQNFGQILNQMNNQMGYGQQQMQQGNGPVDPMRYGLNDRQQNQMQNMRQNMRQENLANGGPARLSDDQRQQVEQRKYNMRSRNAGMEVSRGEGMNIPQSGGRNMASDQSSQAKTQGGRKSRRGMTGTKPGRLAQKRQNKRRNK